MEKPEIIDVEITMGHQIPWHDCVSGIISKATILSIGKRLIDLLLMSPQMWAIHSVKFDWGYLGILSITHIDRETGKFDTEFLALPHKPEQMPEADVMVGIATELEDKIFEDIQNSILEMQKVMNGELPSLPTTSTLVAIDWSRQQSRDRNPALN